MMFSILTFYTSLIPQVIYKHTDLSCMLKFHSVLKWPILIPSAIGGILHPLLLIQYVCLYPLKKDCTEYIQLLSTLKDPIFQQLMMLCKNNLILKVQLAEKWDNIKQELDRQIECSSKSLQKEPYPSSCDIEQKIVREL